MSCNIELCRSRTHQTKSKGSTISDPAYDASNILQRSYAVIKSHKSDK